IVGGQVVFTGTPDSGDLDTDIAVSFDVTNCSVGIDSFADTIDVISCYGCGDLLSQSTESLLSVDLGEFPLCVDGAFQVTLSCSSFDRPNRFRLRENDIVIDDTHWLGNASYSGPWGGSLSNSGSDTMVF